MKIQWKPLLISLGLSLGTGFLAGALTSNSQNTYEQIYKPPFAPPGWAFPVVWTILFILMGIAAYLVYVSEERKDNCALILYITQLAVNFFWSIIFFSLGAYLLAFFWLLLLWYLVWLTRKQFMEVSSLAGNLLIPYLVWITYAGYINLAIAIHYLT